MKYAWIREHRDSFPVAVLCEVLEVSASGYYCWLDRPLSPRAERHAQIQAAVKQVHAESYGIYGSLKITQQLQERPDLESACRNTVGDLRMVKLAWPASRQSLPADHDESRSHETACGKQAGSRLHRRCAKSQVGH